MRVSQEDVQFAFKIIILGAGGVGKTCLFNRFCFNSFNFNTEMTIGINFHSNYLNTQITDESGRKKEKYVVNAIFDLAGQDRFKPLIPRFIEGADGALLVFDSISYASFEQLGYWYNELIKNIEDPTIPKILVGSKSDLLENSTKSQIVNDYEIGEIIKEKKLDGFCRTSALENYNVLEVFKDLTQLMLKHQKLEAMII